MVNELFFLVYVWILIKHSFKLMNSVWSVSFYFNFFFGLK